MGQSVKVLARNNNDNAVPLASTLYMVTLGKTAGSFNLRRKRLHRECPTALVQAVTFPKP